MMNIELNVILYLLLAANALLAAATVLAIFRVQRLAARQQSFWASPTGTALGMQMDNKQLLDAIDARLGAVAEQVSTTDEKPDRPVTELPRLPYENAVRMARHGATVDDLTRTCGLSPTEARLLLRVHGGSARLAQAG